MVCTKMPAHFIATAHKTSSTPEESLAQLAFCTEGFALQCYSFLHEGTTALRCMCSLLLNKKFFELCYEEYRDGIKKTRGDKIGTTLCIIKPLK